MIELSVTSLFLVNAGLLLLLSGFLFANNRAMVSGIISFATLGLALWNICNFMLDEAVYIAAVNLLTRIQLVSAMVFAGGLYYFSNYYPRKREGFLVWPNMVLMALFGVAIFATDTVTRAEWVDGNLVYHDHKLGFPAYSLYLIYLGVGALVRLVALYRSSNEDRDRIRYFIIGVSVYVITALVFNLMLPVLGIYDFLNVGRLSLTVTPLCIFYAMTKHDFMDVTVIINKKTAWLGAVAIMLAFGLFLDQLTLTYPLLNLIAVAGVIVLAALFGQSLQQFLLTTAKRKFVRGWYSTEEVFNKLSERIAQEQNREAIFQEVLLLLEDVFELEESLNIVAMRDVKNQFSFYRIAGGFSKIKADDPLIAGVEKLHSCEQLKNMPANVIARCEELGFAELDNAVVLPFYSPEYLEGLLVLGHKGAQTAYSDSDMRFFNNLLVFVAPFLYRLTPMETLEKVYNENKRKLHEAEIQLIRAQKIESIVHATRQCHHEIRTPLNIIKLGIGRIKTLEELESYKAVAKEEIDHALTMVEETLIITDVHRSKEREIEWININDVIQRSLRVIDPSRYTVSVELSELPLVQGMFSDIQVVITNLIHNAMDAMPDGGKLMFTSHATQTDVVVTVEDTGEGIPESLRSRVWEPYFSGRLTDVGNSTAGRGWGLTIVNRIINEHQGTIGFTSKEHVGTCFTITIPLQRNNELEYQDVAAHTDSDHPNDAQGLELLPGR